MGQWKQYKLGELITLNSGGTPDKSNKSYWGGDIPWISAKFMYDDYLYSSELKISQEGLDNGSRLAPKGSILLLTRGSGLFNRIPVCYVMKDLAYNQDVKCIESNNKELVSTKFLFYWLMGNKNSIGAILETTGIGAGKIDTNRLKDIRISLPPKEYQQALIGFAESIMHKIELNRRINDNLEQQAQALFKAWFVDFEPFRDGEFVNSVLGSTPKELPITYIENIPHNIESGKRPKGGATLIGVPSIGAENIKGLGYYDYSKTKYIPEEYAQTIKKGKINGYELLIYKDGGKPGYFIPNFTIFGEGFPFNEMYINEHVFLLDLMDCGYNVFAYFYMQTPYIMNQLNSIGGKAAIPGINTKDVECLPIYSNESPYVKKFGEIVLPFIKTILSNSLENAKQAKVRDTLLPKLMSGELKINEIETEK